jgi:Tfp pilus assembly protein PilN
MFKFGHQLMSLIQRFLHVSAIIPSSDIVSAVKRRVDMEIVVGAHKLRFLKKGSDVTVPWDKLDELVPLLRRRQRVLLTVDHVHTFQHQLQVPGRNHADAQKALVLDLGRLLPFQDKANLKFQWVETLGVGLLARQAVVKPSTLDNIMDFLQGRGATVQALGVRQEDGTLAPAFLTKSGAPYHVVRERPWLFASVLMASFCCALGIGAWFHLSSQFTTMQTSILQDIADLSNKAKAVRVSIDQRIADGKRIETVAMLRRNSPAITLVWAELTDRLPDNSWVQQLGYTENVFTIEGISKNAEALVPALEQSALFKNVSFSAPVTQSQSGEAQRFAIRFSLEGAP